MNKFNQYLQYTLDRFPHLSSEVLSEVISNTNYKNDAEKEVKEQIELEIQKLNM